MTGYGNGDCVKFINMKARGLLAVYQGFYLGWISVTRGGDDYAGLSISKA